MSPQSLPNRNPLRRNDAGFSLLELLVVLVIIGILVSLLTLSTGFVSEDSELRREAERFEALIQMASEESMLHGYEMGLRFYRRAYEFSILWDESGEWAPLGDDRLFRPREVSDAFELDLEIEGRNVVLEFEPDEKGGYEPQVFILSSGDVTPFMVRFREAFSSDGYHVVIAADGSAEVKKDEI